MTTQVDQKIIDRIQKLLSLARDGGATEGEADNAMKIAERIMLDNNLSMAQIEMNGGAATEKRLKEQTKGKANYRWQRWIMAAIAEANFCHLLVLTGRRRNRHGSREISLGYEIIGRQSNVAGAYHMYDYLLATCARLRAEYEMRPGRTKEDGALFVEGLANRLAERVIDRHQELLAKQKAEAEAQRREAAARASHPGAAPSGTALVVVMADYAQSEADANRELEMGLEPGTLARQRAEREAAAATRQQRINDLMKLHGISHGVAWNMVYYDQTVEEAKAFQERYEREQEEARNNTSSRSRGGWGRTREDRLNERLYTGAAGEGRRTANNVSLDQQVSGKGTRRIG